MSNPIEDVSGERLQQLQIMNKWNYGMESVGQGLFYKVVLTCLVVLKWFLKENLDNVLFAVVYPKQQLCHISIMYHEMEIGNFKGKFGRL